MPRARNKTQSRTTRSHRRAMFLELLEDRRVLTALDLAGTPSIVPPGTCHEFDTRICVVRQPTLNVAQPAPNRFELTSFSEIETIDSPGFGFDDVNGTGYDGSLDFAISRRALESSPVTVTVSWDVFVWSLVWPRANDIVDFHVNTSGTLRYENIQQPLYSLGIHRVPAKTERMTSSSMSFVTTADSFSIDTFAYDVIEITDGYVGFDVRLTVEARPELSIDSASWGDDGGVQFRYEYFADAKDAAAIRLFYASGERFDTVLDEPVMATAAQRDAGSIDVAIARSALGAAPAGATHLLVVGDPPLPNGAVAEADETNNLKALVIPDLSLENVAWDLFRTGVSFTYRVEHNDLPLDSQIDLFWASGPTATSILSTATEATPVPKDIDTSTVYVAGSKLTAPPAAATHLLVVADHDNEIVDRDRSNNVVALELKHDIQLVEFEFDGLELRYSYAITPAPLAETTTAKVYWTNERGDRLGEAGPPATELGPLLFGRVSFLPAQLGVAPLDATHVTVVADPPEDALPDGVVEESDESNNSKSFDLIVAPTVVVLVNPQTLEKGQAYEAWAGVTNNSPVGRRFQVKWKERYLDRVPAGFTPTVPPNGSTMIDVMGGATHWVPLPCPKTVHCVHAWEWIPRENPVKLTGILQDSPDVMIGNVFGTVLDDVKKGILSTVNRIDSIVGTLETVFATVQAWNEPQRSVSVETVVDVTYGPADDHVVESSTSFEVRVPPRFEYAYAAYLGAITTAKASFGAMIGALVSIGLGGPASVLAASVAGVGTVTSLLAAEIAYYQAIDPPDSNYTEIPVPHPEDHRDLLPDDRFTATLALTVANHLAVKEAEALARDRSDGAAAAGDAYWQSQQLFAASGLLADALVLESKLITTYAQIGDLIREHTVPNAGAIPAYLQSNGLPDPFVQSLRRLGWTDAEVNVLAADALALAPDDYGDQQILPFLKVNSVMSAAASLNDLKTGIAIQLAQDGAEVRVLDPQEKADLDAAKTSILGDYQADRMGTALLEEVRAYVGRVSSLAIASNNLAELDDYLNFGFVTLIGIQQLVATPDSLLDTVEQWNSQGRIADGMAATLNQLLAGASVAAADGEFAQAHQAFSLFLDQVRREYGRDVDGVAGDALIASASLTAEVLGGVYPWSNARQSKDVNDDRLIRPLDVLIVINDLNAKGSRTLPAPPLGPGGMPYYLDVNSDGLVSPIDALVVINHLNGAQGEGESRLPDLIDFRATDNAAPRQTTAGLSGGNAIRSTRWPVGSDRLLWRRFMKPAVHHREMAFKDGRDWWTSEHDQEDLVDGFYEGPSDLRAEV